MRQRVNPGDHIEAVTPIEFAKLLTKYAESGHVAFSSEPIEHDIGNWPTVGSERKLKTGRTRGDSDTTMPANVYSDLVDADRGRGGLTVTNLGASSVLLFLATAAIAQERGGKVASIYLTTGKSWDGKVGDALWVGPVSVLGTSPVTLAWEAI